MRHGPHRHITSQLNRKSLAQHTKIQYQNTKINEVAWETMPRLARPYDSSAANRSHKKARRSPNYSCVSEKFGELYELPLSVENLIHTIKTFSKYIYIHL